MRPTSPRSTVLVAVAGVCARKCDEKGVRR